MKKRVFIILGMLLLLTGCKKYTCPAGYTLNGRLCHKSVIEEALVKKGCTGEYVLENNKCKRIVEIEANAKTTCPKGYKYENGLCLFNSTINATKKSRCITGKLITGFCYTVTYTPASKTVPTCPAGYNTDGLRCSRVISRIAPKQNAYGTPTCSYGYTLYLGSCIKKRYVDKVSSYYCIGGTLKGTQCENRILNGMPVTDYSCPVGYLLIGTKCNKNDVKNPTIKYSCDKGYTLNNHKCTKTVIKDLQDVSYCNEELSLKDGKCTGVITIDATIEEE